jgi:PAS domain S-box-containing protein
MGGRIDPTKTTLREQRKWSGSARPAAGAAVRIAGFAALVYGVLAAAWVFFSDRLAAGMYPDAAEFAELSTLKGLAFVAITALLLWLVLWRTVRHLVVARENATHSESRYRALFENSHAAMLIIDPDDGQICEANTAAERFYGWNRDELASMRIQDINLLSPEQLGAEMAKAVSQRRQYFEFRHRRSDGSVVEVDVYSGPVVLDGRTFLFSLITDASERRAAIAAVAEERARFASLFRLAPAGIAFVATDGRWLEVNDRLCAILGYPRNELLNLTFQDITWPEDLDRDMQLVEAMLDGRIDRYDLEKRYRRKSGEVVWAMLSVSLLRNADGTPKCFISVVEEIGARKRAETAMQEQAASLAAQNAELERFNRLSAGRELTMISLKREINQLCQEAGRPAPYDLQFADETDGGNEVVP